MTKLIIYRGEARHTEVPLTGKTMRIGRSAENDVVLEDPGKGVSRAHAELRLEGDKYRLVDLESQNGIWVSGKRVPSVLLTQGVVAAMGPYRLAIDAASPLTQPFSPVIPAPASVAPPVSVPAPVPEAIPAEALVSETGTEFNRPLPQPVAVVDGPGALLDAPAPVAAPVAPKPPKPAPAAKTSSTATVKPAPSPGTSSSTPWAIFAAVAVVLIAASGFGAYKLVHRGAPKPVWDAALATALVNSGKCQDALDQQISKALQANPNDAAALGLKEKCTAPPPPPPPKQETTVVPPDDPVKTNAQKLDEADTALAAKDCQAALASITAVLTSDANDERAKALQIKANECLNPQTNTGRAAQPSDPAAVRMSAAVGGLEPDPGEKQKAYLARIAKMKDRYAAAVALVQTQKYADAVKELDAIAAVVPQGYMDLVQQRAAAQSGIRSQGRQAYGDAQAAEGKQDWNAAIRGYRRAHDIDSSIDVTADISRINDQKLKLGTDACGQAKALYLTGQHNSEAKALYQKVVELLPQNHPCYAEALQRFPDIRR